MPLRGRAQRRALGHWGHTIEGDGGTLVLSLLTGLRCKQLVWPHVSSTTCHSSQGLKARALPNFPWKPPEL